MNKQQILEYFRSKPLHAVSVLGKSLFSVSLEEGALSFEIEVKESYDVADTTFTVYGDEVVKIQTYIKTRAELEMMFKILTK